MRIFEILRELGAFEVKQPANLQGSKVLKGPFSEQQLPDAGIGRRQLSYPISGRQSIRLFNRVIDCAQGQRLQIRRAERFVIVDPPSTPDAQHVDGARRFKESGPRAEHHRFTWIYLGAAHDLLEHFSRAAHAKLLGAKSPFEVVIQAVPVTDRQKVIAAGFCAESERCAAFPAARQQFRDTGIDLPRSGRYQASFVDPVCVKQPLQICLIESDLQ